jgi:hypothetical protein
MKISGVNKMKYMLIFMIMIWYIVFIDYLFSSKFYNIKSFRDI